MVTIITEKLRKQTLEDAQFEPINEVLRQSWEQGSAQRNTTTFQFTGKKDWPLMLEATTNTTTGTSSTAALVLPPLPAPPSSFSSCSSKSVHSSPYTLPSCPSNPAPTADSMSTEHRASTRRLFFSGGDRHVTLPLCGGEPGGAVNIAITAAPQRCSGLNSGHSSGSGSSNVFHVGTPPADPPKKRHCRSLSIPGDGKNNNSNSSGGASKKWQPQASSIWKPVATLRTPMGGDSGGRFSGHGGGGAFSKVKHRSSPSVAAAGNNCGMASSPRMARWSVGECGGGSAGSNSQQSPRMSRWSIGSSHSAGSSSQSPGASGLTSQWSGVSSDTSLSSSTPPESPVPRPASASSGFYDSSASQSSLNSAVVAAVWADTPAPPPVSAQTRPQRRSRPTPWPAAGSKTMGGPRADTLYLRSISMEEPLSALTAASSSSSTSSLSRSSSSAASESSMAVTADKAGSMPAIPGATAAILFPGSGSGSGSYASSSASASAASRGQPPRCRSQPCVPLHRGGSGGGGARSSGGLKRRRGGDDGGHMDTSSSSRPTLDFRKMKETAYSRCGGRARHRSSPFMCEPQSTLDYIPVSAVRPVRSLASLIADREFHALDTIASSPLDYPPAISGALSGSQHTITPPSPDLSPTSAAADFDNNGGGKGGTLTRGNQLPRFANVSDSGCSDTDDLSDIMGYDDGDKDGGGFLDCPREDGNADDEEEQVFELEINSELDLEQIEKD